MRFKPWVYYACGNCGKCARKFGKNPKPLKDCVCGSKMLLVRGREQTIITEEGLAWNELAIRRIAADHAHERVPEDDTQLGE